jgi:argininosuccinate synthase
MSERVLLAYSGGLDTSVILRWLQRERGCEVITYTADLGQGEEVEEARARALESGAAEAIVENLRQAFVEEAIWPALAARATYEGSYLLGTALARPIIARGLVQAARRLGATHISHGSTGKGNDQVRFELSAMALWPEVQIIAPWREWSMQGRAEREAYARAEGLRVPTSPSQPWSMDANLMHISYEGGLLEDPWQAPPPGMFRMTVDPEQAPDAPERLTITFEAGRPVAVDGRAMGGVALLAELNERAGRHGVGRVDMVENRHVGIKSRGVYESPGATLLWMAHRAVETLTLDREVMAQRDALSPQHARLAYNGLWWSPERRALQLYMDAVQQPVSGEARLKLYKGSATLEGRRASGASLYDPALSSFEGAGGYVQSDATGFIRIQGLRLKSAARAGG